jgi:hypothetical protein
VHPGGVYTGGYHPGGYGGAYRPYYGGIGYSGLTIGLGYGGFGPGFGMGYGGFGPGFGYGGYGTFYNPGYYGGTSSNGYYGGTSSSGYYSPSSIAPYPVTTPEYSRPQPVQQEATTNPGPATLTVLTVEGAQVWFDGTPSDQKGTIHIFTSPTINLGEIKTVTVKVIGPSGSPASLPLTLKGSDKTTVDLSSIR